MEKNVRKPTPEKPGMNVLHREKMFRAMFENAAVGMAHVNLDGSFFDVNVKFCEITGYSHDELLRRNFQEITHPGDLDSDLEQAGQLARGEIETYSMEKRYIRKDGSIVWINLTASVVRADEGKALYFIAVIENISERLAAEEKVRESSRFMDLIFRHTLSSLVLTDRDFNFLRVNEVYAKSCGREVSEFPGRNHFEMFPSDFEQVWREAREGKKPWQAFGRPFVFPDHPEWGITYWNIALVPMFDDAGEVEAFLFSLNDVTEMKRAEEELRLSEIRLTEAQAIANLGSWEWKPDSREFLMSKEVCHILGEDPTHCEPLLDFFLQHVPEGDLEKFQQALNRAIAGQAFEITHEITRKDNTSRMVHQKGQVYWDRSGKPERMVGTLQDITERHELDRMKEDFISTVSHELRTPLTSIMGSLGLIEGGQVGVVSPAMNQMLNLAVRNGERLTSLINELLDIQKIESGNLALHLEKVNLSDVVEEGIQATMGYAEKVNVHLKKKPGPLKVSVWADKNRLLQVMNNLVSNAVKFSPKGGDVTIGIEMNPAMARVSVTDRGPGVADEFLPKIFKKFSQAETGNIRNVEGTGLGLSISKAIIEDHGGVLDFITKDGEGATFFFDLPLHETQEV